MRLPRFLLHAMLAWAARQENVRRFRLHGMLARAAQRDGRRSQLRSILEWAARQEDKHDYHRALFGYRVAADHGYDHVDERVTATDSIHRVLRELASRDPATRRWEVSGARVDAAKALLERARRSRRQGQLTEAKRDFQAVIERRAGWTPGPAAHELAEMIDDARGNPREDLRALGYATESDALTDAIALCRTAIRLGTKVWSKGPSALLAQLLEDSGDAAGAAAARAHLDIPDKLAAADDQNLCEWYRTTNIYEARTADMLAAERDSKYDPPDNTGFASLVVARLRPTEVVENIRLSALRQPWDREAIRQGFLVLTDERLLFIEANPDDNELLAIDRTSIVSIRRTGEDERGRAWLEIRYPPSAAGTGAHAGQASVRVGQLPDVWLTSLAPSY